MQMPYPTDDHAKGKIRKRISLIAATLVAALLVGLLVATLTLGHNHQSPSVVAGHTPTPTATPVPPGTVVHTQTSAPGTNLWPSAAWSPDGTRIATTSVNLQSNQNQLQIWDATTGGHRVSVPITDDSFNTMVSIFWSPTGKYLALLSVPFIEIVDSQTGSIVKNIPANQMTASVPTLTGTGQVPFSSFMSDSGGNGFYAVAWTPDGTSLAVANPTGNIELLNPVTGAINKTFNTDVPSIAMALAFSSDGQYLAVTYPNNSRVVVWNVATKAVAFEQNSFQGTSLTWQPGTHHLAEAVAFPAAVQLWDIPSHKLLKTYPGITDFAWSPDGKELATWVDPLMALQTQATKQQAHKIAIIDTSSGSQVAVYTSPNSIIDAVVWSPNGRYIASAESPSSDQNQILIRAV